MVFVFFMLFIVGCFFSLTRDESMLKYVVLVGFLQDPARKLMANEPVFMTVMVGVIVGCAFLRQMLTNRQSILEPYARWNSDFLAPFSLYCLILAMQFVHSLIRYGSPFVPTLGMIFYLAPLVAVSIGYTQFSATDVMRRFLNLHIGLAVIVAITVLLSFLGVDNGLFDEVGAGLEIYDQGTVLKAHSGLMRSSEIAGWHMGAAVCFLLILLLDRSSFRRVFITSVLVVLLLTAIIVTGRRKMIFQALMFGVLYYPFLRLYEKRLASGYFVTATALAFGVFIAAVLILPMFANSEFELYLMRGSSVFGDATDRFSSLGLGSIGWAIDQFGFFGGGLGVAAQGAHHFGGAIASGAAEGGLGKIVSELGVVSLVVVAWLIYVIAIHIHRSLAMVSVLKPLHLRLAVGVAVFVASNAPTFIVASQVFGDVFILLIIGLMLGFVFALPKLVVPELENRHKANLSLVRGT